MSVSRKQALWEQRQRLTELEQQQRRLLEAHNNLRLSVADLERSGAENSIRHSSELKTITDRVSSLKAAVRSDIASLSQDANAIVDEAVKKVDAKMQAANTQLTQVLLSLSVVLPSPS